VQGLSKARCKAGSEKDLKGSVTASPECEEEKERMVHTLQVKEAKNCIGKKKKKGKGLSIGQKTTNFKKITDKESAVEKSRDEDEECESDLRRSQQGFRCPRDLPREVLN